jgi:hypothetical protein
MVLDRKCELTNPVIIGLFEEEKVFFSYLVGLFLKYDKLGERVSDLKKNATKREVRYNPFNCINAKNYLRSNQNVPNNNLNSNVISNNTASKEQPKEKVKVVVDENQKIIDNKINNIVNNLKDDKRPNNQNINNQNNQRNNPNLNNQNMNFQMNNNQNNNYNNQYDIPSINQIIPHYEESNTKFEDNNNNINNFQQMNNQFSSMNVNNQPRGSFGYNEYIHSTQGDMNKNDVYNNSNQPGNKKNIIDDIFKDL